jgi:HlyD family secretion protein
LGKKAVLLFTLLLAGCFNGGSDHFQGYIEGQYTYLSSINSGRLQKLYVVRGQRVTRGQPLFALEAEPQNYEVNKAQATLQSEQAKLNDYITGQRSTVLAGIIAQREQAQADLDLATNNFNRNKQLFEKGVISRAAYDDSLAQVKTNQQKVNQFEQNLREAEQGERQYRILQQTDTVKANQSSVTEAQWQLNQKGLFAPEDGLIFDTYFNEGELIPSNQAVVSLLAPRFIYVIFYIPEPLRAQLHLNDSITFTCDSCRKDLNAIINYISPQAEYTPPVIYSRESRYKLVYRVQAKLTLETALQVNPGQPVEVMIPAIMKPRNSYDFIKKMDLQTKQWFSGWKKTLKL